MKIRFMSNVLLLAVCLEQNPNFFPKQSERGLICAPRPLLTGAVRLSHFEYKTLKVLRSSKYSLLTLRSREQRQKMERKFLVLLRRFRLQNELVLFYHLSLYLVAHFSVLAARRGASSPRLVVA